MFVAPAFTYATENSSTTNNSNMTLIYDENNEKVYETTLTDTEIEALLDEQEEKEIQAKIAEDQSLNTMRKVSSGRPQYTTKHGSYKNVKAPYKAVAGQRPKGMQINTGGTINIDNQGGTSFSFSYTFPAPFNAIGIAATPGKVVARVTGYSANIPASNTKFYKAYLANIYRCRPYIVYKVVNGKKSVYHKGVSRVIIQTSIKVREVK